MVLIKTELFARKVPPIINLYDYPYYVVEATHLDNSKKKVFTTKKLHHFEVLEAKIKELQRELSIALEKLQQQNTIIKSLRQDHDTFQNNLSKQSQRPLLKEKDILHEKVQSIWKENVRLLKNKNYSEANNRFVQFIAKYPSDTKVASAYYFLGQLGLLRENPDQAIETFTDFMKKYPSDVRVPEAKFHVALSYYAKQDMDKAHQLFEKIIVDYPNHQIAKKASKQLQYIEKHRT